MARRRWKSDAKHDVLSSLVSATLQLPSGKILLVAP